ncbi:MAG: DUF2849 domain-containing protein [Beijerinckiaceae bacterium]
MLSVISANRLDDGTVTYLAADGKWVGSLAAAKVFAAKSDAAVGLEAARRAVERNLVLDPFVVEVAEVPTGRRAVNLRDAIRATGPTVRYGAVLDHGASQSNQSDISDVFINVIDCKNLERDSRSNLRSLRELHRAGKVTQRPTFPHPALEAARS